MKQYFLFVMIALGVGAVVAFFLWKLGHAFGMLFADRRLGKELDELAASSIERRLERERAAAERLANGCQHDFDDTAFGAFPDGVCRKCGLAKVRPPGFCDHVWRRKAGTEVGSICEKCGKEHNAIDTTRHSSR